MVFWIVTVGLVIGCLALLALALFRAQADDEKPAEYDLRVYKDQLKEVDRDLARGVIGQADADRVRTEVSRRILAIDAKLNSSAVDAAQPRRPTYVILLITAIVVGGGGFGIYVKLGQPGYTDMPLELRISDAKTKHDTRQSQAEYLAENPASPLPAQIQITPELTDLMTKLRDKVATRPDDLQGHVLLARHEADLGNLVAAYQAQGTVLRLKGDDATALDFATHANLMIAAAEGYVSPEAETALTEVLMRDQTHPLARYYMGLMLLQNDRPDMTFNIWQRLLEEGPPEAPWIEPIQERITDLAWIAGINYTPPPVTTTTNTGSGPSADDMAAAAEMSDEDREEMIRGMVAQLAERLADEGGSPEEWARLISVYGVLGERDLAEQAWIQAKDALDGSANALLLVREAARDAGVSP